MCFCAMGACHWAPNVKQSKNMEILKNSKNSKNIDKENISKLSNKKVQFKEKIVVVVFMGGVGVSGVKR